MTQQPGSQEERDRERDRIVAEFVKDVREYMLAVNRLIKSVKPCPFCGEKARLRVVKVEGEMFIICDYCFVQGQVAVDVWNERPPLSPAEPLG